MRQIARSMALLLCALTAFNTALASGAAPRGFAAAWAKVARAFREAAQAEGTVGASLYVLHDGELLRAEHFGKADLESNRAVDADTIYHWASITKTLTAVAVMQLRDRGRLSLEDPITRYLPEVRAVHNPYGSMDEITLRHLITHSAGFRAPTFPWRGSEPWKPHEPAHWSQVAAMMPYTQIHFAPGSKSSYSNLGISMLGRVIEIVTGEDIEVYLTKNILMPLGMTRSYFDNTPYYLLEHKSNNYFVRDGEPQAQGLDLDTGATVANGGLNGPVSDMAKWLSFWVGAGDARRNEMVLARASLEEMWRPVHRIEAGDGLDQHMGMAFFIVDRDVGGQTRRYVGHTGGQKAFNDFVYVDPQTGVAVIFANNTRNLDIKRANVFREMRAAMFDEIMPLFAE
jgi:CubicO group peptidase (beta-lactamase class C family)